MSTLSVSDKCLGCRRVCHIILIANFSCAVTRDIIGLKKEESDTLLKFLYDHLALGADFQARVKWEDKTVVVWDNRVTQHSALVDWENGQRRHLARITPQAEEPFETPFQG